MFVEFELLLCCQYKQRCNSYVQKVNWIESGPGHVKSIWLLEWNIIYCGSIIRVAIMISDDAMKFLVDWKSVLDRVIIAQFKTKPLHITFIQVCSLREQAPLNEKKNWRGRQHGKKS